MPALERGGAVGEEPPPRRRRDHRPVVGAELARRQEDPPPAARPPSPRPARAAGSSRPPRRRSPPSGAPTSSATAKSLSTSWSTTASWNDAATSATRASGSAPDVVHHRGLQPGEREVGLAAHRAREAHRVRVAGGREPIDRGAARVAEPEEPGDLVERLARGVVDGLPGDAVSPVVLHHDEQRVAAGDDQHDERVAPASALRATPRRGGLRGGSHPRREGRR